MTTNQKIEYIQTDKLVPYARNSRTHSDEQIQQIMGSIKEFGFTNPILIDNDGGIIAGHGRMMAAQRLQIKEVPCIRLLHLTEAQKRAYVIADNKLALNSGWDTELLIVELRDLDENSFNLSLTGFSKDEINIYLSDVDFAPGSQSDQGQLDHLDPKFVTCPHCNIKFDLREHGQG
jgi:ParB family transcriptional regulator, chromosome partitioning protein